MKMPFLTYNSAEEVFQSTFFFTLEIEGLKFSSNITWLVNQNLSPNGHAVLWHCYQVGQYTFTEIPLCWEHLKSHAHTGTSFAAMQALPALWLRNFPIGWVGCMRPGAALSSWIDAYVGGFQRNLLSLLTKQGKKAVLFYLISARTYRGCSLVLITHIYCVPCVTIVPRIWVSFSQELHGVGINITPSPLHMRTLRFRQV